MKRFFWEVSRISRAVPAFVSRHKVWAGIVIVLVFLAVVIYVPRLPYVGPRSGRDAESGFRGHLLQALAGLVLAAGAYYTGRTFALNREGQITERFTRAVEQLADEKREVRLGGIYALERIARDSETHYEAVMEVLTAFLREHSRSVPENAVPSAASEPTAYDPEQASESYDLRVDFQAVATVLGRRDRSYERPNYFLDLQGVDLHGASLEDAHFENASLWGANLSWARTIRVNFHKAFLTEANLSGARLIGAELSRASLYKANLSKANLSKANLSNAIIREANLSGAILPYASLEAADFSGAVGLTNKQLASATVDKHTTLPEHLDGKAGG